MIYSNAMRKKDANIYQIVAATQKYLDEIEYSGLIVQQEHGVKYLAHL